MLGVLGRPPFQLVNRNQPLAPPADQAKLRRDVGVEEVGTDPDRRRSLGGREGDAGDGCGQLLRHNSPDLVRSGARLPYLDDLRWLLGRRSDHDRLADI